jgi:hypothetical protein
MHPRLHLHGVSRTDSWDLLVLAWLCCHPEQGQPERYEPEPGSSRQSGGSTPGT